MGGTEASTENSLAFILYRASSLLLGEGKGQEKEQHVAGCAVWVPSLSHFSFGNLIVRKYGLGSPTEKRRGSGQFDMMYSVGKQDWEQRTPC